MFPFWHPGLALTHLKVMKQLSGLSVLMEQETGWVCIFFIEGNIWVNKYQVGYCPSQNLPLPLALNEPPKLSLPRGFIRSRLPAVCRCLRCLSLLVTKPHIQERSSCNIKYRNRQKQLWVSVRHTLIHSCTVAYLLQGSHGHGKVMESHGIWNLHSRPGKVMEFRKMCSGHGKVMEFQIFIWLVSSQWLINKETLYKASKSLATRVSCFHQFSKLSAVLFGGGLEMSFYFMESY